MNSLIVDDLYTATEYLASLVTQHCPEINRVDSVNDPTEALPLLSGNNYDLLFLDIEMPGMNGFDLIDHFGSERLPPIIFTTAHDHYASKAFEAAAVHYLLKPVSPHKLVKAVKRVQQMNGLQHLDQLKNALSTLRSQEERLMLVSGSDYHPVRFEDIIRVEADGSYSTFFLVNGLEIYTSRRMAWYADQFEGRGFVKSHKSHWVNTQHIIKYNKLNGGELFLTDGHRVPVSSRLRQSVKDLLGLA